MTMSERKFDPVAKVGRTPPMQPDYGDEITSAQLEAIRREADPDGGKAMGRILLYAPAW